MTRPAVIIAVLALAAVVFLAGSAPAQPPEEPKKPSEVELKALLEKLLAPKKPGEEKPETIDLKTYYERLSGQEEKKEEETAPPAPAAEPFGPEPQLAVNVDRDGLISLNLLNVNLRKALSALAMKTGINIAASSEVTGNVSVNLHRAGLSQTIEALSMAGGFACQKRRDLYYVYKPKEAPDPQARRLVMKLFKLKYAEVDKVQEVLDALPGLRLVKVHEPTRTLIVEDTPENIKKIELILEYWDAKPRQVMIEAKLLEVALTEDMAMGVNWSTILGDFRLGTGGFTTATMPTAEGVSPVPAAGSGVFANLITGAGQSGELKIALDALRTKTRVETLSTPRLLAIHGKQAKVQVGGKQGYRVSVVAEGVVSEDIRFIDTGTILDITPYIDNEGNVLLNVTPSINSARIEAGIPVVNTTVVTTWLLAKHGETALIAGLIQDSKTKNREMVPCLGNIPGLGLLFGRTVKGIGKSELVVLITPTIIDLDPEGTGRSAQEAIDRAKELEERLQREPLPLKEQLWEMIP